ncbi:tetratricopeptide repeat protein [Pontibacter sp. 172403-2]|uniref:DUF6377 domain-containing protein n=1 Tax=Pontibacter rufus TaxID=2791028 RepID=UPI0018B01674|nr:DUF6377 domain-containing protein [Pontibacter sp. 172403-2]MBF9254574.1 tetratricopeptide repeat protein [Pontibacter sp. 172403-2]
MKLFSLLLLLLLYSGTALCITDTDSLLNELSHTIENKEVYSSRKEDRIKNLKQRLNRQEKLSLPEQFEVYNKLYEEYKSFKFDSAFMYAQKLQGIAGQLNDTTRATYAKIKLSFILLSSGMFKETLDSLNSVELAHVPDSTKADYYALKARAYYDLANYNMDNYYAQRYITSGNRYLDSAIALASPNTPQFYSLSGFRNLKAENFDEAAHDFRQVLQTYPPSSHDYAIAAASLGNVYKATGNIEQAIYWMAKASVADIKSSTNEAVALMSLAELLYKQGDENRAYTYIKQALKDATFYGARQRKIQVAAILPIIEGERLTTVESQRRRLFLYAAAVTLLTGLVVLFAIIIFRQLKRLKMAKRAITEANNDLHELNDHLVEANKIKEEYIGYSFNVYSEYIGKLEKFKRSIDKKLMARKYDDIPHVLKLVNLKKERALLYQSFDKVFLKLFPDFVSEFNAYFHEEDKIIPKDHESLTIELRIFALIRMGIHEHEQIATILEYSVNTIYTYKTRVKNRSILPNEEFEKKIMAIKAF